MGMVQLNFAVLRYNIFSWYKINKLFSIYPAEMLMLRHNWEIVPKKLVLIFIKSPQSSVQTSHNSNQVDQIKLETKQFIDWALTIAG